MRVLLEEQIRQLITPAEALDAVRQAFIDLAAGQASLPAPFELDFPHQSADMHVKGAFMRTFPLFSIKVICGFYENAHRGLPVASGAILVFGSDDGQLRALLFDNGFLTDLRTGAAGALAADLLAKPRIDQVTILGAGTQARYQLGALLDVRQPRRVIIHNRNLDRAEVFSAYVEDRYSIQAEIAPTVEAACRRADLIITTTPSREPLIHADWLQPGVHITAVGSDIPAKQELDVSIFRRADLIVADDLRQCLLSGEVHHAVQSQAIDPQAICELGRIANKTAAGRTATDQITVVDLTGVGVQDVAVANIVAARAEAEQIGSVLNLAAA